MKNGGKNVAGKGHAMNGGMASVFSHKGHKMDAYTEHFGKEINAYFRPYGGKIFE
jgi:hypothetical protein